MTALLQCFYSYGCAIIILTKCTRINVCCSPPSFARLRYAQAMLPPAPLICCIWRLPSTSLAANPPPLAAVQVTEDTKEDEEVLRKVHHALMEVHLVEGELVCPETGRKFPVRQGVPNMLLHEDGESFAVGRRHAGYTRTCSSIL